MFNLFVTVLLISFALALFSLQSERKKGRELDRLQGEYRKTKIKGGILIGKKGKSKHYSSYS